MERDNSEVKNMVFEVASGKIIVAHNCWQDKKYCPLRSAIGNCGLALEFDGEPVRVINGKSSYPIRLPSNVKCGE
jgi:hypothetical protein